ncbi:protein kinase domain-containing protein, partial [Haematococcus lacustris]
MENQIFNLHDELNSLVLLETIGQGAYGTVFRGLFNSTEVAVKVISHAAVTAHTSPQLAHSRLTSHALELAVCSMASHPSIVQLVTYFADVPVVDLPSPTHGPTLRPSLTTLEAECVLQVASALRYLHTLGLVHCDVKAANVLLRSSSRDPR